MRWGKRATAVCVLLAMLWSGHAVSGVPGDHTPVIFGLNTVVHDTLTPDGEAGGTVTLGGTATVFPYYTVAGKLVRKTAKHVREG